MKRAAGVVAAALLAGGACSEAVRPTEDAGRGGDAGAEDSGVDAPSGVDAGASVDASAALPMLGVYTVEVDGSDLRLLLDAGTRQLSHVRGRPGRDWLTATRYTDDHDGDGYAREGEKVDGNVVPYYYGTEVVLFRRSDPSVITVVTGGAAGKISANSSFTDDGLIFLQTDAQLEPGSARIKRAQISSPPVVGGITVVPTPPELRVPVDPHQHGPSDGGGFVVLTATFRHPDGWMRPVWRLPATGTASMKDVKLVGCPLCPSQGGCCAFPTVDAILGTNDARVNHAGTEVSWMQQHPGISFGAPPMNPYLPRKRILGGEELDLAPADRPVTTTMSYPEWRPDDGELVHWAIELEAGHVRENLYRMRPDGSRRVRIPLPTGLCATHPSYLGATTIVFNGYRCD